MLGLLGSDYLNIYKIGFPVKYITIYSSGIKYNGYECLFGGNSGININIPMLFLNYILLYIVIMIFISFISKKKF